MKEITVYGMNFEFKNSYINDESIYKNNTDGIYLHGNLERINGFDLVAMDHIPTQKGIYDVNVILKNGNIHKAKLYFWTVLFAKNIRNKGLICELDDTEANKYANVKYNANSEYL